MLRETQLQIERENNSFVGELHPESDVDEINRGLPDGADNKGLQQFLDGEIDAWEGKVKWAAGGMMVIIRTKEGIFVPVGYRDGGAPTHPNNLSTPSGIADTAEELVHPRYLSVREAAEELLFFDKEQEEWLRPATPNEPEMQDLIEECTPGIYSLWEGKLGDEFPVRDVIASVQPIGEDTFTLNHPSKDVKRTISGHFIIDTDTHNVDILDALFVDLSEYSIEQLAIFDGEEFDDTLLDRDVYLFTPEQFDVLLSDEPTPAERMFKTGKVLSSTEDQEFSSTYADGVQVTDTFSGVPVLEKSHSNVNKFVQQMDEYFN